MGARKSAIFAFQLVKPIFADHHRPDTINDFRDLFLVCKMHDCCCAIRKNFSQKFRAFSFLLIAIQAIAMIGLYETKPLQNLFERI